MSLILIILSISIISCEKHDSNICDVSDPAEEILWLKEAIDDIKHDEFSYYVQANYEGEKVFYYVNCSPFVNYVSFVLNCKGDRLGFTNDLLDELSDMLILWKHDESKCI